MGKNQLYDFFCKLNFNFKSYKELSKDNNTGKSLIDSELKEAFSFDEIVDYLFPRDVPASADALLIKKNQIFLIEFKTGFERRISLNNFDRAKCMCPDKQDFCGAYADLFKRNLKNIDSQLKANLFEKAVESRWILEYHIFPEVYKNNCYIDNQKINYIIVIDKVNENPIEAYEEIVDELSNKVNNSNFYEIMNQSLNKLHRESCFKKNAFYHRAQALSREAFIKQFVEAS